MMNLLIFLFLMSYISNENSLQLKHYLELLLSLLHILPIYLECLIHEESIKSQNRKMFSVMCYFPIFLVGLILQKYTSRTLFLLFRMITNGELFMGMVHKQKFDFKLWKLSETLCVHLTNMAKNHINHLS